eukprot:5838966-Pleurochrysis_carterae.AAC.1
MILDEISAAARKVLSEAAVLAGVEALGRSRRQSPLAAGRRRQEGHNEERKLAEQRMPARLMLEELQDKACAKDSKLF